MIQCLSSIKKIFSFRPLIYGYANARVHGMFSNLIKESRINEMLDCRKVQSLIEVLQRTTYKEDLVALSLNFKGEELIELALGKNFARFVKKILTITPNSRKHIIKAMLSRWDAHNLKTVILARKQKKTYEQIAPFLVLAATLKEEHIKNLLSAPSAEAFYTQLRLTEFGHGLLTRPGIGALSFSQGSIASIKNMILSSGKDDSALEPLINLADVYSYSLLSSVNCDGYADSKVVNRVMKNQASEKNLSTVLRLVSAGEDAKTISRFMVPGGAYRQSEWLSIAKLGDVDKILDKVSTRMKFISLAKQEYEKTKKISAVEVVLAQENAKQSLKQFRASQLSTGVLVWGLLLKEQEMSNVRKIARAKSLGLSADEIKKMIVMVK